MTVASARAFALASALLMALAATVDALGFALVACGASLAAAVAGFRVAAAAPLAVLLTAAAILLSEPAPVFAALSGLGAAAYLLLCHAVREGSATMGWPTMAVAAGFAVAGVVATSLVPELPWLPLLAPAAVVGAYALAVRPYV